MAVSDPHHEAEVSHVWRWEWPTSSQWNFTLTSYRTLCVHMFVFMCICVHMCVCVCVCKWACAHACVCVFMCVWVGLCTCVCVCEWACAHACVSGPVHMRVCVWVGLCTCVCEWACAEEKGGGEQVLHVNTVDLLRKIMKVVNIIVFILKCFFVCWGWLTKQRTVTNQVPDGSVHYSVSCGTESAVCWCTDYLCGVQLHCFRHS